MTHSSLINLVCPVAVSCAWHALTLPVWLKGVLHDGAKAFPGAVSCVKALHQAGKKVALLSNSSARSDKTLTKLTKYGFETSWFVGAVTSGECAWHEISAKYKGKKVVWFGWDDLDRYTNFNKELQLKSTSVRTTSETTDTVCLLQQFG